MDYLVLSFQEDLLTFVDVRTLKVKHEEQFKYEVRFPCYVETFLPMFNQTMIVFPYILCLYIIFIYIWIIATEKGSCTLN